MCVDTDKTFLKCIWKDESTRRVKNNWEKNWGEISLF